jgi:hypothetical protein
MSLDFIEDGGLGAGFIYKSTTIAYYFNGTTFAQITDVDYPKQTVRGITYLDGTYYVMTPTGAIYGSDLNNGASWSALNVIQALSEPDGGVCLARQLNLLVAFGTYSTEFFYDAGNPTGSPLGNYTSSFLEIGCAHANSVVTADNTLIFMAQGRQRGRSVQVLNGTVPTPISNPVIERLLNADPLYNVNSTYIKLNGHTFYILCLTNYTLVYDFITQEWGFWTQLQLGTSKNISAASWSNGLATLTITGHGFKDGDFVDIASITPSGYNGSVVINTVDSNTITYAVSSNPGTYVSGGTAVNYVEVPFNISGSTTNGSLDMVQDSTTGSVYALDSSIYLDGSLRIKTTIRTPTLDGGLNTFKFFGKTVLVGDLTSSTAYIRHTDNDYQTWSKYRPVDLSKTRPQLNRNGRARRRAFEIINYDNAPIRLKNIEVTFGKGST